MTDDQGTKQIPPTAIILDTISNLVGGHVNGLSKRTQYYAFINAAKGNSLQQPYLAWFARQVLEPLEKSEKSSIQVCLKKNEADKAQNISAPSKSLGSDRLYRGILIDDPTKVALAESRFSRCKGWFEETHKDTEIFRAYFILDRILQKQQIPQEKLEAIPNVIQLTRQEFDKIYQSYDEQLLNTPNLVEDRFQNTLATLLAPPLYWLYYSLDIALYTIFGISTQYPDLEPRRGVSLRILPLLTALFTGFRQETVKLPLIINLKLVGLGPLAERQAVKIATWLTSNGFSKIQDLITENGKAILNNVVAIALGAVLSATIVTRFYTPETPAIDPAFIEAVKGAKFDLFTFRNGDLGIVTYEMPQIPERMRYGDVCRISWRDVNRSLQRNQTGNIMDLADLRCQEGFLAEPLKAFYDERSQAFIANFTEPDLLSDRSNEEASAPTDPDHEMLSSDNPSPAAIEIESITTNRTIPESQDN